MRGIQCALLTIAINCSEPNYRFGVSVGGLTAYAHAHTHTLSHAPEQKKTPCIADFRWHDARGHPSLAQTGCLANSASPPLYRVTGSRRDNIDNIGGSAQLSAGTLWYKQFRDPHIYAPVAPVVERLKERGRRRGCAKQCALAELVDEHG